MALEIKVLDYGDIELESSFLVLGRDCGRTRRVPTYGFLILGGPWPLVIDTGYRILANNGGDAHQEVMHLHIHVFGGRLLGPMLKRSS